eukprot:162502_1
MSPLSLIMILLFCEIYALQAIQSSTVLQHSNFGGLAIYNITTVDYSRNHTKECQQNPLQDLQQPQTCSINNTTKINFSIQCLPLNARTTCKDDYCNIKCTDNDPCHEKNIHCPHGKHCKITCKTNNKEELWEGPTTPCDGAKFHCPQNAGCSVHCDGKHACKSSTFYVNGKIHWFRMTHQDMSEELMLIMGDQHNIDGNILTISASGDTNEHFRSINTTKKTLGFCSSCEIHFEEKAINVIEISYLAPHVLSLALVTIVVLSLWLLYLLFHLIFKKSNLSYLPLIFFVHIYRYIFGIISFIFS